MRATLDILPHVLAGLVLLLALLLAAGGGP